MSTPSPQTSGVASCGCPNRASLRVASRFRRVNGASMGSGPFACHRRGLAAGSSPLDAHFSTLTARRSFLDEPGQPLARRTPRRHARVDLARPQVLRRALLEEGHELADLLLV